MSVVFHVGLGGLGIFSSQHLDKCVPLVLIHDASLHRAEATKYLPQFGLGATVTSVSACSFVIRSLAQLT